MCRSLSVRLDLQTVVMFKVGNDLKVDVRKYEKKSGKR